MWKLRPWEGKGLSKVSEHELASHHVPGESRMVLGLVDLNEEEGRQIRGCVVHRYRHVEAQSRGREWVGGSWSRSQAQRMLASLQTCPVRVLWFPRIGPQPACQL